MIGAVILDRDHLGDASSLLFLGDNYGQPRSGRDLISTQRLKRLGAAFQSDVDKGVIPGAVVLIARDGKVAFFDAFGFQDREKRIPMKADSIFRIASMTKPITSLS